MRYLAWSVPTAALFVGCATGSSLSGAGSSTGPSSSSVSSGGGASSSSASSTSGTGGAGTGGAGHGGQGGSPIHPAATSSSTSVSSSSSSSGTGGSAACPTGNCALRYDGASNYVSVPTSATLDVTGAVTVEAWVYFDQLANCMAIVRKGTSATTVYNYWLHKNISPPDSVFWASVSSFAVNGFSAVTAGAWHHMAGVYNPAMNTAVVYVDGQSKGSSPANVGLTTNGDELRIGIDWDMGCPMKGVIDEVRISTVARYTGTFSPQMVFTNDASTAALWHFDEYAGTIAHDASGNGNDGTIHGATWTTEHP